MIILQTFKELFPEYEDFAKNIITPLQTNYKTLSIYQADKQLTSFENLYNYMINQWKRRYLRYEDEEFIDYFYNKFADKYPFFYIAQLTFIQNETDDLIKREFRGVVDYGGESGQNISENLLNQALAHTNTGTIGDVSVNFDKLKDSIYQKEFETSDTKTTVTFGKKMTNDIQHLYKDIVEIISGNINFGLEKFLVYFNDLFVRYESYSSSYYLHHDY